MKKTILVLNVLFYLNLVTLLAQPGVVLSYQNGNHCFFSNTVNTPDDGYLVSCYYKDLLGLPTYNSIVLKFDATGVLQTSIDFGDYEEYICSQIIIGPDSLYRTIGLARYFDSDTTYFHSSIINQDAEMVNAFEIPLDTIRPLFSFCDVVDDTSFIVSNSLWENDANGVLRNKLMLLKVSWNGDKHMKSLVSDVGVDQFFSMCSNPDGNSYLATAFGFRNNAFEPISKVIVLNKNLSIDSIYNNSCPMCYKAKSIHYINDDEFVYSSTEVVVNSEENCRLTKQDSTINEVNAVTFGAQDTADAHAMYQTLRRNTDGSYWVFYLKNYNEYSLFPSNHPAWIVWQKIGVDFTLEEQYYYGGDAYYRLLTVSTANDSGMLVSAYRYDWNIGYPSTEAFVLKINPDGLLCSAPGQPPTQPHHAIVYPNPGHGALKVEAGPQIFGATFELFDMGGQRVVQQILQTSVATINTAPLTSGVYPWRIVWKGEVVEEGKWVKE
ncbi:MAG: T9SS type A sorting domain-containing protein [Bacteroidales bacterium]|nr:T9SS type A sorting domain-containing protein [Bacteroidales bacterium]